MIARAQPDPVSGANALMWISNENALWLFIPIMAVLVVVGVVLAASVAQGVYHYVGYALSLVSVIWIFASLKHYYDVKDQGAPQRH